MNPVLLKPQSETGAQIVVQGRVHGAAKAAAYQAMKPALMPFVLESFARLKDEADIVLVEGAGSASEVNLRANDIANMGFARAADVPVVIIGDIDRGGVIASLVGTKAVIAPEDAALVRGFLVNKFRGDPALFAPGMAAIAQATGWQPLGLIPFFADARLLPAEDALALDAAMPAKPKGRIRIAVPILPHIANFDDLDPLEAEPAVDLIRVRPGAALPGDADAVILPGSKATIADLAAFRAGRVRHRSAGAPASRRHHHRSVRRLPDARPRHRGSGGHRGTCWNRRGPGLLDVETTLSGEKRLVPAARRSAGRAVFGLRNAYGDHERPRLRAPVRPPCRRIRGRRNVGRWPRDRHLCPRVVRG